MKEVSMNIRVHPDIRYWLEQESVSKNISMNKIVNFALAERYGIRELLEEKEMEAGEDE